MSGQIASPDEFINNMRLLCINAIIYNPDNGNPGNKFVRLLAKARRPPPPPPPAVAPQQPRPIRIFAQEISLALERELERLRCCYPVREVIK